MAQRDGSSGIWRPIPRTFDLSVYVYSETARAFGIDNTPTPTVGGALQRLHTRVVVPILDFVGDGNLGMNSGFRCAKLNAHPKVGGAPGSQQHHYQDAGGTRLSQRTARLPACGGCLLHRAA